MNHVKIVIQKLTFKIYAFSRRNDSFIFPPKCLKYLISLFRRTTLTSNYLSPLIVIPIMEKNPIKFHSNQRVIICGWNSMKLI